MCCEHCQPGLAKRLKNPSVVTLPSATGCRCILGGWHSIYPPPPCPVHDRPQLTMIVC